MPSSKAESTLSTKKRKTTSNSFSQPALTSYFARPSSSTGSGSSKPGPSTPRKKARTQQVAATIDLTSDGDDPSTGIGNELVVEPGGTVEVVDSDTSPLSDPPESDAVMAARLEREWAINGNSSNSPSTETNASKFTSSISQKDVKPFPIFLAKPSTSDSSTASAASTSFSSVVHPRSPSKPKAFSSLVKPSILPLPVFPDLDVDPLLFDPATVETVSWPAGRVTYAFIVEAGFVKIAATTKRLVIQRILINLIRTVTHHDPASLLSTIYLMSNHIAPSYLPGGELGVGSQILSAALKSVTGLSQAALRKLSDKLGDGGDVAFEAKVNVRTLVQPAPLVAEKVYRELVKLAGLKGTGVQKLKGNIVHKLLVAAKGEEVRFLVRTLVQNLRIGAVRLTLTTSIARAFTLTRPQTTFSTSQPDSETEFYLPRAGVEGVILPVPEKKGKGKGKALPSVQEKESDEVRKKWAVKCEVAERLMRRVYVRHPNYDHIIRSLLSTGLEILAVSVPLTVGIPLSPMLGSITRALDEVYIRLPPGSAFTSEAKLDGQRVQAHVRVVPVDEEDRVRDEVGVGGWWGESGRETGERVFVRLFSRHLEDMTEKYPDIVALILALLARPIPVDGLVSSPHPEPASPFTTNPLFSASRIDSFILDAEVVAVDKTTGAFRTFQELTNRAKKDVQMEDVKVLVGVFAFDLMLLNGEPLLNESLRVRRHLMRTLLPPLSPSALETDSLIARFDHVQSTDSTDPAEVQSFFQDCVTSKAEGIMVKLLDSIGVQGSDGFEEEESAKGKKAIIFEQEEVDEDVAEENADDAEEDADEADAIKGPPKSPTKKGRKKDLPATYQPDVRSLGWLKVKKDYIKGGIGDSLDLVPIGAWHGNGRKASWWSPILLACYNPDSGLLEAVCKCMSGFSDAFYKALTERFPEQGEPDMCWKSSKAPSGVDTNGLIPDVWFKPCEVWEIKGADITLSPVYPAGRDSLGGERGLSVRFPRFIQIREEKGWEEATTSEQFSNFYRAQSGEEHEGELDGEW